MKSLILYWSAGGNTKKVADTIETVLVDKSIPVDKVKIEENLEVELCDYDLVFMGAPSYRWIPPLPVRKFIGNTMDRYRGGARPIGAPRKPGKFGVVFCTFGGIHTGIKEGYVAGKYMAQFFEHVGFFVLDEWYTPGKFHGWDEGSQKGKMGDISDRPNLNDLKIVANSVREILQGLDFEIKIAKR